ncbi:MAG: hypothetical protein L6R28_11540 [Planctomycetes bacterium]|nr:hypothetical protein [Planctomycetota bacterium]
MNAERLFDGPIIHTGLCASIGTNINGPSLICVPDWLPNPLGRYYLYFAHHQGLYIRLAYANRLEGPWRIHEPGTLQLAESHCIKHVASPDLHIDDERREIRMYYHGPVPEGDQRSKVALSKDGLRFQARKEALGMPYFRVFRWRGAYYAVGMTIKNSGLLYRSQDGLTGFEPGPYPFVPHQRHTTVLLRGDTLHVFYSIVFQAPEHIVCSTIDLSGDWKRWQALPPVSVLKPDRDWEGADCPQEASKYGAIHQRAWQLRDPGIFEEYGRTYLLYSVAGEAGIAIAELKDI